MRTKRMRYVSLAGIAIILVFIFILILIGQENKNDNIIKVAVFTYQKSDTFIFNLISELSDLIPEHENENGIQIQMEILDAQNNQNTQKQQIERYIQMGYDILCVNLVDRTFAAEIVDRAQEANIPLIFFNREPVKADILRGDQVYYIGTDAKETAILQGNIIYEVFKENPGKIDLNGDGKISYVIMEGELGHQDTIIRTEGVIKTLKDMDMRIDRLAGGVADFQRDKARDLMEQWLVNYNDQIELVICNSDDMALGAFDSIDAKQLDRDIQIIGIDGTKEGLEAVNAGKLLGTVDCNIKGQASAILEIVSGLSNKKKNGKGKELDSNRYIRVPISYVISKNA